MPVTRIAIRAGAKLAMYKRIVERLETNPGVRGEDVMVSVVDTPAENWSFGKGKTQFYNPAERQVAVA
jgi:hypothetical protein